MASQTDIYNLALQKIGLPAILSVDDDSTRAAACRRAYAPMKRLLLQSHDWNCAITRAQLAEDATGPSFGRGYSYTLPADFIRLMPLDPLDNTEDLDYQIEGKKIVSDISGPIDIRYIGDIDPGYMDAHFVEVLACRMALAMSMELSESNTKKADLKDDFKFALAEARRANAIQNRPAKPAPDSWETVRY